jgi:hypothetical protein
MDVILMGNHAARLLTVARHFKLVDWAIAQSAMPKMEGGSVRQCRLLL